MGLRGCSRGDLPARSFGRRAGFGESAGLAAGSGGRSVTLPWGPAAVRVQSVAQLYFPRCMAGRRYGRVARPLAEAF